MKPPHYNTFQDDLEHTFCKPGTPYCTDVWKAGNCPVGMPIPKSTTKYANPIQALVQEPYTQIKFKTHAARSPIVYIPYIKSESSTTKQPSDSGEDHGQIACTSRAPQKIALAAATTGLLIRRQLHLSLASQGTTESHHRGQLRNAHR